ncbi:ABC transporter ATP-binding protein [Acetivibrio straminisolvens]|uniref:ABC transporter ATP-binding protein n=1 Tax=Acetivibrio straminisolvens JCM 21531 TaxID=1294263 RepID=W4V484_9FIRM|nr:ABC transporter ATP-binding protein [Acetivibrio straminisolvens]GAE87991.1 ABC transporter ATP-binding protein [Acetivibrio straminisolvens JCM 21531]
MEVLRAEQLSKVYGKGDTATIALDNVNLTINYGDFIAITGPSGSGKSTLLHLLGGLDKPSAGKVYLEGKDIYKLNENQLSILRRRKIGFVFQFFNLVPVLTVKENIILPIVMDGKQPDMEYIDDLIQTLGLESKSNALPHTLSGGQQQRVAIGRALAAKPSVVLADEPTGNLDIKTGREIIGLIKNMSRKYQQTVIIITHDPSVASECNRIIHIEDGQITGDEVMTA